MIKMERAWAMPNKWTFTIKPIWELLIGEIENSDEWIDPFAGQCSFVKYTNDINTKYGITHMDALDYLKIHTSYYFDGAIYDPPYSNEQYRICYKEAGKPINTAVFNAHYNAEIKNHMARIIRPGGKAICFGWNSTGLGKKRGFELYRVLLVCHGRQHNDTIVTCEKKIKEAN